MSAIDTFRDILMSNKNGNRNGIYSVCSAHETVLKAGMLHAREENSILLIESTSNQVNQDGGYTGMRPHDFAAFESAWERVCGVVVQPGVAFNNDRVLDYNHEAAIRLSDEINNHENLIYETHSTDYQTPHALSQMVSDHFCILKVGPWLTFTYREALFALAEIEENLYEDKPDQQSFLRKRLEQIMIDNPKHWEKYYPGTGSEKKLKRKFSYLDRSRYYWPDKELHEARGKLLSNLRDAKIPAALISQYLPNQYLQIRQGRLDADPEALVLSKIREVLSIYSEACGMKNNLVR